MNGAVYPQLHLYPQGWVRGPDCVVEWRPTQARRSEPVIPDKPTEPWSDVGLAGFALIALGFVVAMAILAAGLM
jgi:hypothetical protein